MVTSPRRGISYPNPDRSDSPDIPLHIKNLVDALELDVFYAQGLLSARPISTGGSPGVIGRLYFATDNSTLYWDFGTGWQSVNSVGAGSVTNSMLADDSVTAAKIAADAVGSSEIAANAVTGSEIADGSVTSAKITDGTITGADIASATVTAANLTATAVASFGTLASRPAASSATGKFYYATDQDSICVSDGSNWIRINDRPGDIIWTAESTARTGYIICTGQAWPSTTGIYADLFSKWGSLYPTTLPDWSGREFVAKGTHADVNTIGFNEGLATVANRRPKHKHTNTFTNPAVNSHSHGGGSHAHTVPEGGAGSQPTFASGSVGTLLQGAEQTTSTVSVVSPESPGTNGGSVTIGPQTGAEPTDSNAYIVLQPQVKL